MSATHQTNRNLWSIEEVQTLTNLVKRYPTNSKRTILEGVKILGRSYCSVRLKATEIRRALGLLMYNRQRTSGSIRSRAEALGIPPSTLHARIKNSDKPQAQIAQTGLKVLLHNGVSKEAQVLVKTNELIVAKSGDYVITIHM